MEYTPQEAQVAFLDWFVDSRSRFFIPLYVASITDVMVNLEFDIPDAGLGAVLVTHPGSVVLSVQVGIESRLDEVWDILADWEASPARTDQGWICRCCRETGHSSPVYESLRKLLEAHNFEPFLAWVNSRLTKADTVSLHKSGGTTWARLTGAEESGTQTDSLVHRIRLR